jgi:hypothetical protein
MLQPVHFGGMELVLAALLQVHDATIAHGAYPSPYNYYNFPKCAPAAQLCSPAGACSFLHFGVAAGLPEGFSQGAIGG